MRLLPVSFFSVLFLSAFNPASSHAGEVPMPPLQIPVDLTATARIGYSSRYEYRGMVLNEKSSGGMVLATELAYEPEVPLSPMLAFTYRDMEVMNSDGQVNLLAGAQTKINSSYSNVQNILKGGYQMISGGLPGVMKSWEKDNDLSATSGTTHEFLLSYTSVHTQDYGSLFANCTGGYSFHGLTGWYFSTGLGYLRPFTERVSASLSFNASWSFSYWTSNKGCDQLNILLTLPVQVRSDCLFTPFIMADWGAHNAKKINQETGRKMVENFAVVAGVSVEFIF